MCGDMWRSCGMIVVLSWVVKVSGVLWQLISSCMSHLSIEWLRSYGSVLVVSHAHGNGLGVDFHGVFELVRRIVERWTCGCAHALVTANACMSSSSACGYLRVAVYSSLLCIPSCSRAQ